MREPRAKTGRRTMTYMAASLSFTAAGLLVCYLLWRVAPVEGKTMNAVLFERMAGGLPLGTALVVDHAAVGGPAAGGGRPGGFIDGPRVLSNMALDNWVPRRFASLSGRLTTQNGIVLMGVARPGGAAVHARRRAQPGRHVQHQRVPDLLAVDAGDDDLDGEVPRAAHALAPADRDLRRRSAALRHGAGRHHDREVQRGRLDHHRGDRPAAGPVLPDPRPLPAGRRQARPALPGDGAGHRRGRGAHPGRAARVSTPRSRPPRCWSPATAAWACTRC